MACRPRTHTPPHVDRRVRRRPRPLEPAPGWPEWAAEFGLQATAREHQPRPSARMPMALRLV
eukprot:10927454-Alexandrium_andersonii.AAC.1